MTQLKKALQHSTLDDDAWEDLLSFIEERRVIPIVGPELLRVDTPGGPKLLYDWLAERLAAKLNVDPSNLPQPYTLNDVVCLFLAAFSFGFFTPTLYSIGQTLAGPRAAGKWIGIQGCIANIAGIIAPIVTGFVVDISGRYYWAFVIAAAIPVVGIVGWGVLIRRVEQISWSGSV